MQNHIPLKILKFFLDGPYEEVYLRELAKNLKLSVFAVKKYVDILIKEGIIAEERKANLRYFKANVNNLFFKHLKISFNIDIILKSGLIKFLNESVPNVSSIAMFGSMAKGENDKKSDVDLVVIGKQKHINLSKFEEKIGREIKPHIFSWSEWNKKSKEDRAFYFEVIGPGIPLYGELPIVN